MIGRVVSTYTNSIESHWTVCESDENKTSALRVWMGVSWPTSGRTCGWFWLVTRNSYNYLKLIPHSIKNKSWFKKINLSLRNSSCRWVFFFFFSNFPNFLYSDWLYFLIGRWLCANQFIPIHISRVDDLRDYQVAPNGNNNCRRYIGGFFN